MAKEGGLSGFTTECLEELVIVTSHLMLVGVNVTLRRVCRKRERLNFFINLFFLYADV